MKKLLFFLLAAASLTACKKNNVDAPGGPSPSDGVFKIKTKASGADLTTYNYDGQGRVVSRDNGDGSKWQYEYAPGVVNVKLFNSAGVFQYGYKYELNADGLCARITVNNNPNYEILTLFNPDKTVAKRINHINGNTSSNDYFYSKGNLDSTRFNGSNGDWESTIVNTYYADQPNVLLYESVGETFYGKNKKNMRKSEVYKYPDGSSASQSDFSYEYDAQGRVIKETCIFGNNIGITLFTYY